MLAYSGWHSPRHVQQQMDERARVEKARLVAARKRHRALPKWQRLLNDQDAVRAKFTALVRDTSTARKMEKFGQARFASESSRLLRQYNRLTRLMSQTEV